MKRCPRCNREFPDKYRFCLSDGAALSEALETQSATVAPMVQENHVTTAPLSAAVQAEPAAPRPSHTLTAWLKAHKLIWVPAVILVVMAIVVLLIVIPPTVERQINDALQKGILVTPEGASAYDLYLQLKRDKPNSKSVRRVEARALPIVRAKGDEFFQRWYKESEASDEDWRIAQRLCDWAVEMAPGDNQLLAKRSYCRGQLAFRARRNSDAISAYQEAIRYWPDWALPYNSLGVLYARMRDFDAAIYWYSQAAARDPNWSFPHSNLGSVYLTLNRYTEAESAYLRAISLNESRPTPHLRLSEVYERQGRLLDALREAERALELDPYGNSGMQVDLVRRRIERLRQRLGL